MVDLIINLLSNICYYMLLYETRVKKNVLPRPFYGELIKRLTVLSWLLTKFSKWKHNCVAKKRNI